MRHDRHFVEELENESITAIGIMVPIDRIETNREQPRSNLGDLADLVSSIRTRGVLEPLLVRPLPGSKRFQLIAGERRFQAAVEAGLTELPCVEMTLSDQEALEVALVENLQRKDLSPFEEAEGYRTLATKYGYSHDQVGAAVGKSRTTISESLRLLDIPPAIRDLCRHADIAAKSVLLIVARATSIEEMERIVQEIAQSSLDRDAARLAAKELPATTGAGTPSRGADMDPQDHPFKPINIRHQATRNAPVRFSISIRRPGISRAQLVELVQDFLDRLRSGELDGTLARPADPAAAD
jgi:ParB family chromosome partitioning protein